MRVAAGFFAGLFAVGAFVQLNDPDPLLWIAAYVISAGLSLAAAFGRPQRAALIVAAAVFALWFSTLAASLGGAPREAFTSFEMQATSHEEPREAVGLALLTVWNAALAVWSGRRPPDSRQV